MARPEPVCPHCRFELGALKNRFGAIPRFNKHTTDVTAEYLSLRELRRIDTACTLYGRRFPQSHFAVVLGNFPHKGTIREYGFYLLNRCQFTPSEAREEKNFTVLLLICPEQAEACLTTGYGLESHLSEDDLAQALQAGAKHLAARRFVPGAKAIIGEVTRRLILAHAKHGEQPPAKQPAPATG